MEYIHHVHVYLLKERAGSSACEQLYANRGFGALHPYTQSPVQDTDWGITTELKHGDAKRRREPSAADAGDSRPERRSRSQRGASELRTRAEEGSAGAEGAETKRPKATRESHSRKESKSHRSDKCGFRP